MQYSRGSEWNRWDFHIHTPGTLKNDQFSGGTIEEKWEKFYTDIENYMGDGSDPQTKIAAIGITDYLSIKNYFKVIDDGRITSLIPFIFPNVELRISPIAKESPINIHCLFNPKIAQDLYGRFFSKLKFTKGDTSYSALPSELIRFGKSINPSLDDQNAYKKGVEQFIVSHSQLFDLFEQDIDLRKNTLIAISNKTTDGASGIANPSISGHDSQLTEIRAELYRKADFIFSANDSDIKYFLGKTRDSNVLQKYGKYLPCVNGCDAHTNSNIFESDSKKYCWVKGVPSFEGMKEITFEPKSRVRIQELKPETKADYYVIDKVLIDDENFSPESIPFNDKLTCIIGGKSTGKSLLLHNMAEAISRQQVEKKLEITKSSYYKVDNVKVYWRDGQISEKGSTNFDKKIVYIPQTYLNRLSDESEEKTEIDDIIQEILLQNAEISELYETYTSELSALKEKIDKKIYDLISTYQNISKSISIKMEIGGDSASVEKEILKIKQKKEKLIAENNITEYEISTYDGLLKGISVQKNALKKLENDKKQVQKINNLLEKSELTDSISENCFNLLTEIQDKIFKIANDQWTIQKTNIIQKIDNEITLLNKAIENDEKKILELKPKIESNDAISQLSNELVSEEQKLSKLQALETQIEKYKSQFDTNLNEISHLTITFQNRHNEYVNTVNTMTDLNSDDLEFIVSAPFRTEYFFTKLSSYIDNRKLSKLFSRDSEGEIKFFVTDFDEAFVKKCITMVLDSQTGLLKKSVNPEEVIRCIASDWYNITYTIKMDGDEIKKMSPGKKALVLLKLLINLAESKCPILIDQPEDDLDNRSIYNELVEFIRDKKISRQIIIVTHNANLVVGCDAEEVIIANQRGNNAPNYKYRFEYRTGALEEINPIKDETGQLVDGVLYKTGIQQQICDILEGGKEAFRLRKNKYSTAE